jgi:hypothetical protein
MLGDNNTVFALTYTKVSTNENAASASSAEPEYPASQAFDTSLSTFWLTTNTGSSLIPEWLQYQLPSPMKVTKYRIYASTSLLSCDFKGSVDGSNWVSLDTQSDLAEEQWHDITFTNTTSYQYYRIDMIGSFQCVPLYPSVGVICRNTVKINEFELYIASATVNITANPSSISWGYSSTISWTSQNSSSVSIAGIGSGLNPNDSVVVWPEVTTTYEITAYGIDTSTATDSIQVTVNNPCQCSPSGALSGTYECGGDMITSGTVSSGVAATLMSAGSITLSPGFHAYSGSTFTAKIGLVTDNDPGGADGLYDCWEREYFGSLDETANGDWDQDGLTNLQEYLHGTSPTNPDTDGDGMPDNWEVLYGLNPLVNDADGDMDNDGYTNFIEYGAQTDPGDINSFPEYIYHFNYDNNGNLTTMEEHE